MRKTGRKQDVRQEASGRRGLREVVRQGLLGFSLAAGLETLQDLLEEERTALCGPRYAHLPDRQAGRGGTVAGSLVLGGRRITVPRPRVRAKAAGEVVLPTWQEFAAEDLLNARAYEQMMVGVATRGYSRSLEATEVVPEGIKARGTSKSAVSRRFVALTHAKLTAWLARPLGRLDLAALMVDGIHFADQVILVALGIDATGAKHVLGLWEGATENASVCAALVANLRDRGMRTDRSILAVIDGSKALAKALRNAFGERVLIQRCQVHKKRNVLDQLPEKRRAEVKAALIEAYRSADAERARRWLLTLAKRLDVEHPGAAASLREGLDETLTVMQLELPRALERTLSTTNPIENVMSKARTVTRNVKRWRSGQMRLRWMGAVAAEAEKRFRRLAGHAGMAKLVAALRARDARFDARKEVDAAVATA